MNTQQRKTSGGRVVKKSMSQMCADSIHRISCHSLFV